MKTNYILIDFENVQPTSLSALAPEYFKIFVFVGASQDKVGFELAATLQSKGDRAEYIKIAGNGSNALDFHIAFYLGQLAKEDPDAYFHIISKDKGFDPLIQHLRQKGIVTARSGRVCDLPLLKFAEDIRQPPKLPESTTENAAQPSLNASESKPSGSKPAEKDFSNMTSAEQLARVVTDLQKRGTSKPRKVSTLSSTISSIFKKQISEKQVAVIIKKLQKKGHVIVKDTKVSYALPKASKIQPASA